MRNPILLFPSIFLFICIICSCQSNKKFYGLWEVKEVSMGNQSMTPMGRWTKLNDDGTQTSGNGWKQHSEGVWTVDNNDMTIELINSNGIDDEFGPFKYRFENNQMKWKRQEEGQDIEVTLIKTDEIPKTIAEQLLGVWSLDNSKNEGQEIFLFFRWDNIVVHNFKSNRTQDAYRLHGHRNSVEILSRNGNNDRRAFDYSFEDGYLYLETNGTRYKFKRIRYIP